MSEYVYQEYPKCLYNGKATMTVHSSEEEQQEALNGWVTAEQFFGYGVVENEGSPKKKRR
jgi:hypothetical protein